jgi:glycosyltransferase involved in cell wall biosynthesis
MIVVDGEPTDDTAAVVRKYANADKRIKLVTAGGVGRSAALNRAFAETQVNLIANLDADVSDPRPLGLQVATLAQHPELALLATHYVLVIGDAQPELEAFSKSGPLKVIDVIKD